MKAERITFVTASGETRTGIQFDTVLRGGTVWCEVGQVLDLAEDRAVSAIDASLAEALEPVRFVGQEEEFGVTVAVYRQRVKIIG